jgi:hypothetical protein
MFGFGGSRLRLCYVIMSEDSRFWLCEGIWGAREGNDMCDAKIYLSRKEAAKELSKLSVKGTVFEIGLYNGRPVMLVDSYDYWVTGKYRGVGRSA